MRYIYVDVLIIVNLYVNYFLLCAVQRITNSKADNKRKIAAALFGACMSLSVLLPKFLLIVSFVYKLLGGIFINLIAFGKNNLIKKSLLFMLSSIVFAGVMLFLSDLFSADNVLMSNGSVYYDISFIALLIFTAIAYLLICLVKNAFDKSSYKNGAFRVIIDIGTKRISLNGVADTGNMLLDNLTGKPVIVCDKTDFDFDISNLLDKDIMKKYKNLRYLPYSTIEGEHVIPVFSPVFIEIHDDSCGNKKKVDALVGLAENSKSAIFNPKMLL